MWLPDPPGDVENGLFKTWTVGIPAKHLASVGNRRDRGSDHCLGFTEGILYLSEKDVGSPHLCFLLLWKEQSPWAEDRLEAVNVDLAF